MGKDSGQQHQGTVLPTSGFICRGLRLVIVGCKIVVVAGKNSIMLLALGSWPLLLPASGGHGAFALPASGSFCIYC